MTASHSTLILLANVAGLRNRQGGKHQPRYRSVNTERPGQRFAGERSRYAAAETGFRADTQTLYRSMTSGEIGMSEFYVTFSKELYKYQVRMYLLGRRAIGREDAKLSTEESKMLHGAHSQEMKYFNGFIRDYLKGSGKMPYAQRLDLYALGGYRIYLRGALATVPFAHLMRFPWIENPEAVHCEDCKWKAEESKRRGGFTLEELEKEIGYPGERCQCGRRCRCHLELPGGIKQLPRTRPTAFKAIKRRKTIAKKRNPSRQASTQAAGAGTAGR